MIKRFNDYDKIQSYGDFERLPKGGYICKILNVETCQGKGGEYLKIALDIEGGDYHHFFTNDYKSQQTEDKKWRCNYLMNVPQDDGSERDGWAKRKFKTFTEALEDSNDGYRWDWDESKWKGKLIGGLFNEREYETQSGKVARVTNLAQVCPVAKIKDGSYKLPADKLLDKPAFGAAPAPAATDFMQIPDNIDEELPFK